MEYKMSTNTGNISETVQDRTKITIGLKKPTITNLIGQIHKNTTLK